MCVCVCVTERDWVYVHLCQEVKFHKIFLHFQYDTYISQQLVHSVTSRNTHYYIMSPNVQSYVHDRVRTVTYITRNISSYTHRYKKTTHLVQYYKSTA